MRFIIKPRPISVWLEPIEVAVIAALIMSAAVFFMLVRIHKRVQRVERLVTAL